MTSRVYARLAIAAFVTSFVAAGHGAALIGLLLIVGWGYWGAVNVLSALAILVVVIGSFLPDDRTRKNVLVVGVIFLGLAWSTFFVLSDSHIGTALFSLHFLVSVFAFFRSLARGD